MRTTVLHRISLSLLLSLLICAQAYAVNVIIETPLGDIEVALLDDVAPETVANFLKYVNDGDYQNSFIHRSVPGFVIQGGGFTFVDSALDAVPTDPPVVNEPGRSNTRGTVAMAKQGGDPDSATSQWFINLADNSANLDNQNGGFTVFGEVVGDGMVVADAVAELTVWDAGGAFTDLPLIDYPGAPVEVSAEHLVFTEVAIISDFIINAGNDAWVNDAAPFQGLFVTAFPGLNLVFLAWFTFDTVIPVAQTQSESFSGRTVSAAAIFGADDQRWVTALGSIDGNKAVLKAELTTGGVFNGSDPLPTQDTDYGTITIEFESCSKGSVDFNFPSLGESGEFEIHRVLEDSVALCVAQQP
jgi:cyclophilin family peptidyl-prolyl cis-trans isomerase